MSKKPLGTCDLMAEPHSQDDECVNWRPEAAPPQPSAQPSPVTSTWGMSENIAVLPKPSASAEPSEPTNVAANYPHASPCTFPIGYCVCPAGQEREEAEMRVAYHQELAIESGPAWRNFKRGWLAGRAALRASGKEGK